MILEDKTLPVEITENAKHTRKEHTV